MTDSVLPFDASFVAEHAMSNIGLRIVDDQLEMAIAPQQLTDDGHLDLGVLGVLADTAGTQLEVGRAFLHADMSVTRIARPTGSVLHATAEVLRAGKRTAMARIGIFDDDGTHVADGLQQLSIRPVSMEGMRQSIFQYFDGSSPPDLSFREMVGIETDRPGVARIPVATMTRNGMGTLHGGVTFGLIDAAVTSLGDEVANATVRFLKPADGGPCRAEARMHTAGRYAQVLVFDEGQDDLLVTAADVVLVG